MAHDHLLTIKNPTGSPITVRWDSVDYTFEAGESKTLQAAVAAHFREKAPSLTIESERYGDGSQIVATDVIVSNGSGDEMSVTFQGVTYTIANGATATFDASIADLFAFAGDVHATNGAGTAAFEPVGV